jgi:DNA-binding transcriptional MocR family regulator
MSLPEQDLDAGASAVWLAGFLTQTSANDIAQVVGDLIATGRMPAGTKLPTVRALAQQIGVSPGSISAAWSQLRASGLIETKRRGGTVVRGGERDATRSDPQAIMDLAYGVPDLALQPDLGPAFAAAVQAVAVRPGDRRGIVGALRDAVEPSWPFTPQAWTTAGGGTEGTILAIEAAASRGNAVAVEAPTSPRILGVLARFGMRPIAVSCDREGPLPESLQLALEQHPAALIIQPRGQVPLGHSLTAERARQLAQILAKADHAINVVEDDHMGPISSKPIVSLGDYLPDRVIHVRGYCKTFGIELRTCVIAGGEDLVARAQAARVHGFASTSRILQEALAYQIIDRGSQRLVERARQRYAWRREALADSLRRRAMEAQGEDGMLIWLKVRSESATIFNLAQLGVSVGPGSRCYPGAASEQHVRISTSLLPDALDIIENLADKIATSQNAPLLGEWD